MKCIEWTLVTCRSIVFGVGRQWRDGLVINAVGKSKRLFAGVMLLLGALPALAEPWLAVQNGARCELCHANPAGGGLRTEFGNLFAQQLAVRPLASGQTAWTGKVLDRFSVGANARTAARQSDQDNLDTNLAFGVDRVTLYLKADLTEQMSVYLDQQVAPGGSLNREAWLQFKTGNMYLRAGRLFLPFGWRLEDNSAFVREGTGVTMNNGDNGLELGFSHNQLNMQLALTNGSGGEGDNDDGKMLSSRVEWLQPNWRVGFSGLFNDTDRGERTAYGVFAGLKTGPVNWLFEHDRIEDEGFSPQDTEQGASLVEANMLLTKGHNLKLTLEALTFDDDREDRYRASAVYEYFPIAFTQLRLGVRSRDSDDPNPQFSNEEFFVQAHVFF